MSTIKTDVVANSNPVAKDAPAIDALADALFNGAASIAGPNGLLNEHAYPERAKLSTFHRQEIEFLTPNELNKRPFTSAKLRYLHSIVLAHAEVGSPVIDSNINAKDVLAIIELTNVENYLNLRDFSFKNNGGTILSQQEAKELCKKIAQALIWQSYRVENNYQIISGRKAA